MPRQSWVGALGGAVAGALLSTGVAAQAQEAPPERARNAQVVDYYDYYAVGYDTNYDDDWFFDFYAYDPGAYQPQYDYYTDYDYGADRFEWEERGLFDAGRGSVGRQPSQERAPAQGERGREPRQ